MKLHHHKCTLVHLTILLSLCVRFSAVATGNPRTTPFNQWPMVMAHDAATTYMDPSSILSTWTQTQTAGGITRLLNCGARGFDWRPRLSEGHLVMHHGPVSIDRPMAQVLDELLHWTSSRVTMDDFVVLSVVDCDGGKDCIEATKTLLETKGITYIENCSTLVGLTADAAWKKGRLPGGKRGSVLAVFGCKDDYYDPSVTCSGYDFHNGLYTCYANSATKSFPLDRLWRYAKKVVGSGPQEGRIYTLQMIWQESQESIAIGEVHGSSLVKDEEWSKINEQVASRINDGRINVTRINFVEINNLCDSGMDVLHALRKARGIGTEQREVKGNPRFVRARASSLK